ncbi:hypothetical protein MOV64_31805 [Agrobacterium sp. BETTINA12B]|nr:hypothetical protein [Agrobacterium sp. BETTINA12B]
MVKVTVVVREIGRLKPDYSLDFELPSVPSVNSYISIQRSDKPKPYGEDLIVRQIWWRLDHPETVGYSHGEAKIGSVSEIIVECEPAASPYSSTQWLQLIDGARTHGTTVEDFKVERFSVRERDLPK